MKVTDWLTNIGLEEHIAFFVTTHGFERVSDLSEFVKGKTLAQLDAEFQGFKSTLIKQKHRYEFMKALDKLP